MTLYLRKEVDFTLRKEFIERGQTVNRGEWQSLTDDRPQMKVREIYDIRIETFVGGSVELWQEATQPNLPWAEDHFQERVSGEPLNPGEQYKNWPWYKQGVEEHKPGGKFSHTYMERFWPQMANAETPRQYPRWGIRFALGDLIDLVNLLIDRPMTRQAYLPIWFPEDLTASVQGHRVPCSLGYHFLVKPDGLNKHLECTYFLRSCDFYRYLWDDIYMAGRLLQWVADQVPDLEPCTLTTHIVNLHVFSTETGKLETEYQKELTERMNAAGF